MFLHICCVRLLFFVVCPSSFIICPASFLFLVFFSVASELHILDYKNTHLSAS